MRRWSIILLLILGTQNLDAEIHTLKIYSAAIGDSTRILVTTPASHEDNRREHYPIIIMLHGWDGDETQWAKDADLQKLADIHDVLLVLPDGGNDGWWLDPVNSDKRHYETHVNAEILPLIQRLFNGSNRGEHHGVLGLSMGGYGAVLQAFLHPEDYAAVVGLSSVLDLSLSTHKYGIEDALGPFEDNGELWVQMSPQYLAADPPEWQFPRILLICGVDDPMFAENVATFQQLQSSGYYAEFLQAPGTHSHDFWRQHVDHAVLFIMKHLQP